MSLRWLVKFPAGGRRTDARAAGRALTAVMMLALVGAIAPGRGAVGGREDPSGRPVTRVRARYLMGTHLVIDLGEPARAEVFEAVFAEVDRLEQLLSNWIPTSEISRLNGQAAAASFRCSPDLFAAVYAALRWAEATDGAFDPTVEPDVRRLGLRGAEGRLPARAGVVTAAPAPSAAASEAGGAEPVGWRHVLVKEASRSIRFDAPGVGIDLGGIGKGFALDRVGAVLRRHGVETALLDFGGQVRAFGAGPGGRGWPIGIAAPDDRSRPAARLVLRGGSLATSGNSERGLPGDAESPGHILDPARGKPVEFDGSVSVLAPDATSADALSTALFVMGPERGSVWADRHGVAALYLWRGPDGRLEHLATKALEETTGRTAHFIDLPGETHVPAGTAKR